MNQNNLTTQTIYTDAAQVPKLANGLTPLLTALLDSRALSKHRAMIGFEQEVLAKKVDRFGWDRDAGSAVHDRMVTDWMNALQDFPLVEVQKACIAAISAKPDKMPNEGHVKAQILAARRVAIAGQPKPVEQVVTKQRLSDESEAERVSIMASFNTGKVL
jgi:hypothetical protein